MSEECAGDGRCHGCLGWCSRCGTVSNVCDFPECDQHKRPEEIQAVLDECVRALKDLARMAWALESEECTDENAVRGRDWRSAIRNVVSRFKMQEREVNDLEEELAAALSGRLVPRRKPLPPPDPRQLRLFA